MDSRPRHWGKNLRAYEVRALQFHTDNDFVTAVSQCHTDAFLYDMPRAYDDDLENTMLVPAEAVPHFTQTGLRFDVRSVKFIDEIPPGKAG